MKNYSYRIIGTSIIEDTNFQTLKEVRSHVLNYFGNCRIEYWTSNGKISGETNVK